MICSEEFLTKQELQDHKQIHDSSNEKAITDRYVFLPSSNIYECKSCKEQFCDVGEMKQHSEKHIKVFNCDICDENLSDPYRYSCHMYSHSGTKYECPLCEFETLITGSLWAHIKTVHYKKYTYNCRYCGKGFSDCKMYKEHEIHHKIDLKFTCIVCNKGFKFSQYLQNHQIKNHRVNIEGVFLQNQCKDCLQIFKKETSLKKHLEKHKRKYEKKFLCDACGMGFRQSDKLKLHYRVHTGYKPHACNYCEKTFSKKESLRMHERVHSGERPYSCTYCGKCFNQRAPLRIHIRGHTGERPYVCNICSLGYTSKGALTVHRRSCTGGV